MVCRIRQCRLQQIVGYIVTLKKMSMRYHPFFLTMVQAFVGSLFFLPFCLINVASTPLSFNIISFGSIVYLGLFITLGTYGLYNFGVSRIPANQASAFVNLIPIFTFFLGWIILGEAFTMPQYIASAIVFAEIIISRHAFEKKKESISVKLAVCPSVPSADKNL